MSASILQFRAAAAEAEDPWHTVLGHPPHRETFPVWTRQPADIEAWLKAAENEFPAFGMCQITQGNPLSRQVEVWRQDQDAASRLLHAYIGIHRRHALMAKAMHGEAMRLGLAAIMNKFGRPATPSELIDLSCLFGEAILT